MLDRKASKNVLEIVLGRPIGEVGYGKLIPSHIIFICTFDQYGRGRYCYTFENRCIEEPDLAFDARQEEKRDILMRMLCNGQTPEAISKMTDEPLSFVYEVQKEYLQTVKEGSDWNGEEKETL